MKRLPWLVASLAACTYQPVALQTTGAPVAIIGDGSSEYRVAAGADVFLDGSGSHDPDGGELLFSWSIEQGCTHDALEPSQLVRPVVKFASLDSGAGCQVSLTVTDDEDLSSTATATVELVTVGTYVGVINCVDRDPVSDVGRGGWDNPWCSPLDGMAAAIAFHVADVWIASGDFDIDESLVVPGGVKVHGGRNPSDEWRQSAFPTHLGLLGNAEVLLNGGEGALLSSLAIFRQEHSNAMELDLVTVRGASASIVDCTIGAYSGTTQLTTGPTSIDATARSLHVISGEEAVFVSVTSSQIVMPYLYGRAYGIYLDGRGGELSVEIANSSVVGDTDTWTGAALRTLATRDVVVRDSTIVLNSVFNTARTVLGVLDGIAGELGFDPDGMDVDCERSVCFASQGLEITNTNVLVTSLTNAVAIALMGSEQAMVRSTVDNSFSAFGGDSVVGLWTYDTDGVIATGLVVNAVSQANHATQGFVVGVLDGAGELGADGAPASYSGGSDSLLLQDVVAGAVVSVDRTLPTVAAGIALLGTRDSEVSGTGFNTATASAAQPIAAIGLWTLATEDLTVESSFWWQDSALPTHATDLAAAHVDGWPRIDAGSVDLSFTDNYLGADLYASGSESLAACLLWSGTGGALSRMRYNTVGCAPSGVGDLFHSILTLETSRVDIDRNHVIRERFDPGPLAGIIVGIRDGLADAIPGSSRLRVKHNWVFTGTNQLYDSSIGIWIDHRMPPAGEPRVQVENNALLGAGAASTSQGVLLHDAEVEVVNNTVHAGDCHFPNGTTFKCDGPNNTVGIEVHGAARLPANGTEVWLANNLIHPGFGYYATAVVDHGVTIAMGSIDEMSLSVFKSNLLVIPPDTGVSEEIAFYVGWDSGSSVDVPSGTALDNVLGSQTNPELFVSNYGAAPPLCTDDNVHIDTSHWNIAQLQGQADPAYAPSKDIDLHDRDAVTPDIGADEVDGTPCGGY